MEHAIKALSELRVHWAQSNYPNISEIAKKANVARGTAHRYLTGVTKGGNAETVRALAIAMDRPDIAESIPYPDISKIAHIEDYIAELDRQWNEKSQQQIADLTAKHKQELDELAHIHRLEREQWHTLCNAMHEESASLRASFDKAVSFRDAQLRRAHIEKWICFALFLSAVAALIVRR